MAGEVTNTPRPVTGKLPPATGKLPPAPAPQPAQAPARARQTGDLNQARPASGRLPTEQVGLDSVALPPMDLVAAKDKAKELKGNAEDALTLAEKGGKAINGIQKAGKALGAVGVVTALGELGAILAKSPVDISGAISCLGELGTNLASAAGELAKYPGLTKALQVFGGVGGVISGIMQLKDTLTDMKANGATLSNITGALAGGCSLVGGVCMALTPFFPPLAAVGAGLTLAGAALNVGKLAIDNWDTVKEYGGKAASAVASGARAVGGAIADGASAVGGAAKSAWNWLTS